MVHKELRELHWVVGTANEEGLSITRVWVNFNYLAQNAQLKREVLGDAFNLYINLDPIRVFYIFDI